MRKARKARLERAGWQVGTAREFLGLTPAEDALIELKLALGRGVKARRTRQRLTQAEMARRLGSSQSRVAKMEAGDPSVSLDLVVRSLFAMGATPKELAKTITTKPR